MLPDEYMDVFKAVSWESFFFYFQIAVIWLFFYHITEVPIISLCGNLPGEEVWQQVVAVTQVQTTEQVRAQSWLFSWSFFFIFFILEAEKRN